MTAAPRNSKIDKRTRLRSNKSNDITGSGVKSLAEFNADQTEEKLVSIRERRVSIVQKFDVELSSECSNLALHGDIDSILNTMIDRARNGDMQTARFLIDRFLPDPQENRIKFDLRKINGVNDAIFAWQDVFLAISQGEITLKDAQSFCGLLKSYIDTAGPLEFSDKLTALESLVKKSS